MRIDTGASVHEEPAATGNTVNPAGSNGSARLKEALAELKLAVDERHVEPICSAYQGLRATARGMSVREVIAAIDEYVGANAMAAIISAYSHRECFMCRGGQATCDQCKGTGFVEPGRVCLSCDGKGVIVCGFCRGTGLADFDTVPSELKKAVLDRQLVHVRRELAQLKDRYPDLSTEKLLAMPDDQRRQMARWLIRLQARLSTMMDSGAITDDQERSRITEIAARIDSSLESLKS